MLKLTGRAAIHFPATHYDADTIKGIEEKTFGRRLTPDEWAHLSGTPDDGEVSVKLHKGGNILLEGSHPHHNGKSAHILFPGPQGKTVLHNAHTDWTRGAGKQFPLRAIAAQTSQAQRLGIGHIEQPIADHRQWSKLGFDGQLDDNLKKAGELKFGKPVATISDTLKEPGGLRWWNKNGGPYVGQFSLKPGSDSLRVMSEFLRRRALHSTVPPVQKSRYIAQNDDSLLEEIWRSLSPVAQQGVPSEERKPGWKATVECPGHPLHNQQVIVLHSGKGSHTVFHHGQKYSVPSKYVKA